MSLNPRLVKESFAVVEPVADRATAYFYGRLFAESPHLRGMFPPAMDMQRDRLFSALTRIVWSLDSPDSLTSFLGQLGRDHRKYGVIAEHYTAVGNALLATIKRFAADIWDEEIEAAWVAAYTVAANLMIESAESDSGVSPAWWLAEVVDHERRTEDISVLTMRPTQRLPYTPGQYVNVQVARWPRVWRTFSIANAPRLDNTITLHVRSVPCGWVSNTLTKDTRVGDTIMLGPPMGTMTLCDRSHRDVLCVAGGTGLAPIKAIIEHMLYREIKRPMTLYWGGRRPKDIYMMELCRGWEANAPHLKFIPVVSDALPEDDWTGRTGFVHQAAVEDFPDLSGYQVYSCGAPIVINSAKRDLVARCGLPEEEFYADSFTTEADLAKVE